VNKNINLKNTKKTDYRLFPLLPAHNGFLQTNFSYGVTNLANMTASEECSLLFLLICLSQFEVGWLGTFE
jgi:hypothetical protein